MLIVPEMAKGEKKAKKGQSASGDVNSTFASFKAVAKVAVYFVIGKSNERN